MLLIKLDSLNPFFTFAVEEYFLNNFKEDIFIAGVHSDAVSIGVNQNTIDEVNALYIKQNNIKVIRRNSGGSAVFHDKGCINYSFIVKDDDSSIDDFNKFSEPILNFLKDKLNLDVSFEPRNKIIFDNQKIGEISKYKNNGNMVQHGTLHFSTNLKSLTDSMKIHSDRESSSKDYPFANISSFIENNEMTSAKLLSMLYNYIKAINGKAMPYEITKEDYEQINKIIDEKYSTWDWNFGQSPTYNLKKQIDCPCGLIEVFLNVDNGIIKTAKIHGDFYSEKDISDLENALTDKKHKCDILLRGLKNINVSEYFGDITNRFFVESLF